MTLRLTAALVLFLCAGVLGIAETIIQFAIISAVNAKLPPDDQFNALGWWITKTLRLHNQYRRLYPNGRLLLRQGILEAVMFSCIVAAAGLIGFPAIVVTLFGLVTR